MNWQTLIKQFDNVSASDAIVVAKVLEYFPLSEDTKNDYPVLFTTLLSLHLHQQQGNTCLALCNIANSTVFNTKVDGSADTEPKPGIGLPSLETLCFVMSNWLNSFDEKPPYILLAEKLFIQRYFEYESQIAAHMLSLNKPISINLSAHSKSIFTHLFAPTQTPNWQAVAVASALSRQFMILNGGPGTGKTYTVARFLIMMQCLSPQTKVQLVAPTGKAAQRLSESLNEAVTKLSENPSIAKYANNIETQANTIHKTLGSRIGSTQIRKNEKNPLQCGLLIIDEFSMVDTAMFAKLLRACKPNTRLLLVGDSAQLSSVEAGNLLPDLTKFASSSQIKYGQEFIAELTGYNIQHNNAHFSEHLVTLSTNHRSNQAVTSLASAIQEQKVDAISQVLSPNQIVDDAITEPAYLALQKDMLKPLLEGYLQVVKNATTPDELLVALTQFRVLCPIRKGGQGVEQVNEYICKYLLNHLSGVPKQGLFHGQAIIITENDASTGLSNGDIGVVWQQHKGLVAVIERDNSTPLSLSTNRLPRYETAFALTIHKTQGSEYKKVLIILPYHSTQGCSRELLYTGVTRAKEEVYILARASMLKACLTRSNKRDTHLADLLLRNT